MLRRRASDTQPEPPARPPSRASFCQSPSGSLRGPAGPSHGDGTAGPGEGAGPGVLRPCRPELTGDDADRVPAAVRAIGADRITDTSKLTLRSNVRALSGERPRQMRRASHCRAEFRAGTPLAAIRPTDVRAPGGCFAVYSVTLPHISSALKPWGHDRRGERTQLSGR